MWHYRPTHAQQAEAARLRQDGLSYREIGERLGVYWQTARRWCRGESGTAERDPIDWDSVFLTRLPDAAIARRLGVSQVAVSRQRKRRGRLAVTVRVVTCPTCETQWCPLPGGRPPTYCSPRCRPPR